MEVLQPHRLVPGERHVHLHHIYVVERVVDARLLVDVGGALAAGPRVHFVAAGHAERLASHCRSEHPGRRRRRRIGGPLGREHHGARAVGRRAALEVPDRIPQHHRAPDHLVVDPLDVQVRVRVLQCRHAVLHRDLDPDVLRRAGAADVLADGGREVAAGARDERRLERDLRRERPHRVRLRLFLERHGEDAVVDPGLDERRSDDRCRAAD